MRDPPVSTVNRYPFQTSQKIIRLHILPISRVVIQTPMTLITKSRFVRPILEITWINRALKTRGDRNQLRVNTKHSESWMSRKDLE